MEMNSPFFLPWESHIPPSTLTAPSDHGYTSNVKKQKAVPKRSRKLLHITPESLLPAFERHAPRVVMKSFENSKFQNTENNDSYVFSNFQLYGTPETYGKTNEKYIAGAGKFVSMAVTQVAFEILYKEEREILSAQRAALRYATEENVPSKAQKSGTSNLSGSENSNSSVLVSASNNPYVISKSNGARSQVDVKNSLEQAMLKMLARFTVLKSDEKSSENLIASKTTEEHTGKLSTPFHVTVPYEEPHIRLPREYVSRNPNETTFIYMIPSFNAENSEMMKSPWHIFDGFKWRLLLHPKGKCNNEHFLSAYLECGGPDINFAHGTRDESENQGTSSMWNKEAKTSLILGHSKSPMATYAVLTQSHVHNKDSLNLTVPDEVLDLLHWTDSERAQDKSISTYIKFNQNNPVWGFGLFAKHDLLVPGSFADDDMNVVIMAKVALEQDNSSFRKATNDHDSKRATSSDTDEFLIQDFFLSSQIMESIRKFSSGKGESKYIGLKNQGATCYLNSLLQTLYFLNSFREAVYNIPLEETGSEGSEGGLPFQLQKLFYELDTSKSTVQTTSLTKAIGWNSFNEFTQHDIQEMKLILYAKLEEKMMSSLPDEPNIIRKLFQGKIVSSITCLNINYKSRRMEDFTDLSLDVKGCSDLYQSFSKYVQPELMDGDNKYRAEGYKELQQATKNVSFFKLPPVLHLHLKRFEFDMQSGNMTKLNDRLKFDTEINLCKFVENSDGNDIYVLHSVLVHNGSIHHGHYRAFIRTDLHLSTDGKLEQPQWYMFDDEVVYPVAEQKAVMDNYGGTQDSALNPIYDETHGNIEILELLGQYHGGLEPTSRKGVDERNPLTSTCSAYMLQYLRKSEIPNLLGKSLHLNVPNDFFKRFGKKKIPKHIERDTNESGHVKQVPDNTPKTINFTVITSADISSAENGSNLVDWGTTNKFKVRRGLTVGGFKTLLLTKGLINNSSMVRIWGCSLDDRSMVPEYLIGDGDNSQAMDCIQEHYCRSWKGFPLFVEDLTSTYCIHPGKTFNQYRKDLAKSRVDDSNAAIGISDRWRLHEKRNKFPLEEESLIFLKLYSTSPIPHLKFLGHAVVKLGQTVENLYQLFHTSMNNLLRVNEYFPMIPEGRPISVYHQGCYTDLLLLEDKDSVLPLSFASGGGHGDIFIFEEDFAEEKESSHSKMDNLNGDDKQDVKNGDSLSNFHLYNDLDLPLGGRPIPTAVDYFDYMNYSITVEFRDKNTFNTLRERDDGLFYELLRLDSIHIIKAIISGVLGGTDLDLIQFYPHDRVGNKPSLCNIEIHEDSVLDELLEEYTLESTGYKEWATVWYTTELSDETPKSNDS